MKSKTVIISCLLIGVIANTYNALLMLRYLFEDNLINTVKEYLGYGGFFALAWTILLFWAMFKPLERRAVLIISVIPLLGGILTNSIVHIQNPFPFWKLFSMMTILVTISSLFIFTYIYTKEKKDFLD